VGCTDCPRLDVAWQREVGVSLMLDLACQMDGLFQFLEPITQEVVKLVWHVV
jgi:hypothetical protein